MRKLRLILAAACLISSAASGMAAPQKQSQQSKREGIQRKIQAELDELNGRISALEAKSAKRGAKDREAVHAELKKLKADRDSANKKLEKLKSSSSDMWETIKSELQRAIDKLKSSFRKIEASFK